MRYKDIIKYLDTVDLDSKPICINKYSKIHDPLMYVEIMKSHVESVPENKRYRNWGAIGAKNNLELVVKYYKNKEKNKK
jgi:hypothetical protein